MQQQTFFNLFADDTSLYLSGDSLQSLSSSLNSELLGVERWICANKLSLNLGKSVYLLFAGRKPVLNTPQIILFGEPIERKSETKFLGLIIDDKLNWKSHANYVLGKVSRMVGVLSRIRNFINKPSLLTVYYSLIYSHMQHGIIFWGSVCQSDFNKILIVQKKVLRVIEGIGYRDHCGHLFLKYNLLKLSDVRRLEMAKFIFYDINFLNVFNFQNRETIHNFHTRNSSSLVLPYCRTNILLNSVFYAGVQFFNSLPNSLKSINSYPSFKFNLKRYLT